MRAKQFFFAGFVFSDRGNQMGNINEITIIQVFANAVSAPGAAAHAQGEIQSIIEAATITEGMGLVDQYAHHVDFLGETNRLIGIVGMNAAGMTAPLDV